MTSPQNTLASRRRMLFLATTAIASAMLPMLGHSDDKDDEGQDGSNSTPKVQAFVETTKAVTASRDHLGCNNTNRLALSL